MGKINVDNLISEHLDAVEREFEDIESDGGVTAIWNLWNRIERPRPHTSSDSTKIYFLRDS